MLRNAALAIAVIIVVLAGRAGWRTAAEKDAALTTPSSIGSLRLDLSDDGRATAGYWQGKLSAAIDLDETVGAMYLDGTGKNAVFFGGVRLLWAPGSVLDSAFGLVADDGSSAMTGLRSVDAGPLGGTMKCGRTTTKSGDTTVCGWADHGSLALALFPNRAEPDSATLLRQIRSATQTRSSA
jgi:hypothetical protein